MTFKSCHRERCTGPEHGAWVGLCAEILAEQRLAPDGPRAVAHFAQTDSHRPPGRRLTRG